MKKFGLKDTDFLKKNPIITNFQASYSPEDSYDNEIGRGYPEAVVDEIIKISEIENFKNLNVAVMDDYNLEMTSRLVRLGAKVSLICCSKRFEKFAKDVFEPETWVNILYYKDLEKDMKFDLGIHNPPYDMGNKIISDVISLCSEHTVLMPVSQYKAKNLYKHITSLKLVDPKAFKDASIQNDLSLAKLIPQEINQTYEDLKIHNIYDQSYVDFYEMNSKLTKNKNFIRPNWTGDQDKFDKEAKDFFNKPERSRYFCFTRRAVLDGAHELDSDAFDVLWNVKKDISNVTKVSSYSLYEFETEKACENFTKFFYAGGKTGLMTKLTWGLKSSGGSLLPAIPQLDWSRDRDYEHMTYEELLKYMREDNPSLNED